MEREYGLFNMGSEAGQGFLKKGYLSSKLKEIREGAPNFLWTWDLVIPL